MTGDWKNKIFNFTSNSRFWEPDHLSTTISSYSEPQCCFTKVDMFLLTPLSLTLCTTHPAFLSSFRGNSQRMEHKHGSQCMSQLITCFWPCATEVYFFKESRGVPVQPTPSNKTYASIYQNDIHLHFTFLHRNINKKYSAKMCKHIHLPPACFLLVSFLWMSILNTVD